MLSSQLKDQRIPAIIILDFGSQYSELIARRIRETEVFSLVMSHRTSAENLRDLSPKGIILSGGPSSVYEEKAPLSLLNITTEFLYIFFNFNVLIKSSISLNEHSADWFI